MMKKIVSLILILCFALSLCSCGEDDIVKSMYIDTDVNSKYQENSTHKTADFSVSVPNGWNISNENDANKQAGTGLNSVTLLKDKTNDVGIQVTYYNPQNDLVAPLGSYYTDSKDISPFEIGGRVYNGFTAKSSNKPIIVLWTGNPGEDQFLINVWSTNENFITVDNVELLIILKSIKVN